MSKYFFYVIYKTNDEETQRNYLQNFKKKLILMENTNKTQEIRPSQYSMDEIFNRFKSL